MAEWISFGTTAFGSLNGAPFERVYGFPEGDQFSFVYRIGSETNLAAHIGKVIRGIDAAGDFDRMWVDQTPILTVNLARGATKQSYAVAITMQYDRPNNQPNNKWALSVPATTVPLGLLRAGAGQVNTNQWAGISTSSFITLQGTDDAGGRRPNIARLRYLVSPKPRWIASAPTELVQGDTSQRFEMQLAYTDGTPVVGLQLQVFSAERNVVFGAGSAFSVTVSTDSNGRISLPVRCLRDGGDAINVQLTDPRCDIDYFDPPLSGVFPVNTQSTTVGGRLCVVLPARPAIAYQPEVRTESMSLGWNAGAYSLLELEGDCEIVVTDQKATIGAVLGFVTSLDDVTDYTRITHGFYFTSSPTGRLRYQLMEHGKAIGAVHTYAGEQLRVQRIGTAVRYLAGTTVLYTSRAPLVGALRVGCSLYATGDAV